MEKVLILTPIKDGALHLETYFTLLRRLDYPARHLSLGWLVSDSSDGTAQELERRLPGLLPHYRRVGLWTRDFGYRLPPGVPRFAEPIQQVRRTILARSRNHLLFRALADEDWVLWIDVDVIDYPPDVVQRMLATGRSIVHPHGVLDPGGPTFDLNAWRDHGRLHMAELRAEGELVRLDAVGGTMLLVRADVHRDGLVFPPFPYGRQSPLVRPGRAGEIETEGLGLMAKDMGVQPWGMPWLEIRHFRG
jgi:hypothetical protein